MNREGCVVHGLAAASADARGELALAGRFRPLVGRFERVVASISGPDDLLGTAAEGLPEGAARPEAIAVRLRREGVALHWGEPELAPRSELLARCEARGRSSLELVRSDPSLAAEMQLGGWFDGGLLARVGRRLALRLPISASAFAANGRRLQLAAELAFWRGVRAAATEREWERFTRSAYTVLVYHRLAGEHKPGQERLDLAPRRFERQLSMLRRAGFRPLAVDELLGFHEHGDAVLPRRGFVVTVDDAIADCRVPLERHPDGAHLYVPTASVGGSASWLDDEPLLDWEAIGSLAGRGVAIGAHGRHHRRLGGLSEVELVDELDGSLLDLRRRLGATSGLLAYPNGDHDLPARAAARAAGFRAAFTTEKGRNGAGVDRYCLRRVSVHAADGAAAVLWKVLTGDALPASWLALRRLRGAPQPAVHGDGLSPALRA